MANTLYIGQICQ